MFFLSFLLLYLKAALQGRSLESKRILEFKIYIYKKYCFLFPKLLKNVN